MFKGQVITILGFTGHMLELEQNAMDSASVENKVK